MITEQELQDEIKRAYLDLSPVELVEEYNRMFGTDYIVDDIIWE